MIAAFYIENRYKLANFIKGYAGDFELAEDVVQEVFLRLLLLEAEGKTHRMRPSPPGCQICLGLAERTW